MPAERIVLEMDYQEARPQRDITDLAQAVIEQCFVDLKLFIRKMQRDGVTVIPSPEHQRAMWHGKDDDYRCKYHDALGAYAFLTEATRHDDRLYWCEMLNVDPNKIAAEAQKQYGHIFLTTSDLIVDN